jgi:hypothetical protein
MATAIIPQYRPPEPPITALRGAMAEKRISRITVRLSDTLRASLEHSAKAASTTLSDYAVHILAAGPECQAMSGRTVSDVVKAAIRALDMLERDFEGLTHYQRMWVLRRIHAVEGLLLGEGSGE